MAMDKISSSYFISREGNRHSRLFKRIRMMPMYSFPHHADLNHKWKNHAGRFFIHIDFDAFYAQVEQRDNPRLKGKPVSVGGNGGTKGIVMTASYEARALGVETGMSVFQARELCPELISVPCYGPKYESIMQNIQKGLAELVPEDCIEQYSVDECFVEITPVVKNYVEASKLAYKIKLMIKERERLTASLGLSFNKTYAKLATKFQKPDGLTVVREENRDMVYRLPAGKIWGVGRRIEKRLAYMGINTIGELANSNINAVHKEFGINGIILRKLARGEDTSVIQKTRKPKDRSFNHAHTLTEAIYKPDDAYNEIRRLSEYMGRKMRAHDYATKHLILTIRFDDLGWEGGEMKLQNPTNDDRDIYHAAIHLYKKLPQPDINYRVRTFALTVFDLHLADCFNLDLFKKTLLIPYKVIDMLKERYGESIIRIGLGNA
jgi:DNA polymerase-4